MKLLLEQQRAALGLSARQAQVLELLLNSKTNKEVASLLNLSVRTIAFHVSATLAKVGVPNRRELFRWYRQNVIEAANVKMVDIEAVRAVVQQECRAWLAGALSALARAAALDKAEKPCHTELRRRKLKPSSKKFR